jgi:apolipoprotein N-acyltransferase
VFVEEVAQRDSTTLAERLGAGPEWLLSALGAGALLAVATSALRRRPRRGTA